MQIDKDHYVPMRDGVHLAVDIYHPDDATTHAAIVLITPYEKDGQFGIPLASDGRPFTSMPIPTLPDGTHPILASVSPLVNAGFVVAVADARGTGFSEGVYDYYNVDEGPFDGYDLVEWIAEQPWCDGNVGIMGSSAAAISCYTTALTHPPHLKAMVPNMFPADFYPDQWRIGGVFRYDNRIGWGTGQYAHIVPIDPGSPDSPNYERKRAVFEARFHQAYERISAGKNAANLDWLTELYQRDTYDEFWARRSFVARADELTIPTLHGGVWYDHFLRGTLTAHEAAAAPKLLFVGPGGLSTRADLGDGGFGKLQLDWFDHFLRGADNGILERPGARIYLLGREEYVDLPGWPVPTASSEFFLGAGPTGSIDSTNDGTLRRAPGADQSADVLKHEPQSPVRSPRDNADQRSFDACCLTYTSPPLTEDLTVIGTPWLILHAATDAADVDFCVRLCDVFPDGRSRLLNTGALKSSHRDGHENPTGLRPGETYEFEIEIWATATVFKAGHRVRVDVSASDFPFFESNPHPSRTEIFHDDHRPSRLVLPVVSDA